MVREGAFFQQFDHRRAEVDHDSAGYLEDEPGLALRAPPGLAYIRRWPRSASPLSKLMTTFFPWERTPVTVRPTRRSTWGTGPGPWLRARSTTFPSRARRSRAAKR
jgi:hypothetical protein